MGWGRENRDSKQLALYLYVLGIFMVTSLAFGACIVRQYDVEEDDDDDDSDEVTRKLSLISDGKKNSYFFLKPRERERETRPPVTPFLYFFWQ